MKSTVESWMPPSTHRPKILVVDDQALNIRVLHELFRADYDVYMATDGEQALSQCRSLMPDIVLLDVVMPGMSGHEVCRLLKEDHLTKNIPIIFITGKFDEVDEVMGFELGAVDFIRKPINPVITRARVKTHLTIKQQADLLSAMALIDGLTGIANRRRFDKELHLDWLQCMRESTPLSIILIDVDFFKNFNDRYGHQSGDSCLQLIAQTIRQSLQRPYDLAARYGGEEFTCLLPNTTAEGAVFIANNIVEQVRALHIEHLASTVDRVVTVSVGVATTVPTLNKHEPWLLVEASDQQLYLAKKNGRAQISAVVLV